MYFKIFWILRAIFYKIFFNKIGNFSYFGKPLFLLGCSKITIGNKVRIFPNSRMEVHGQNSFIKIEDDVSIGQGFHVISGGRLVIKKGVTIAPNVFVNNMDNDYQEINVPTYAQKQIVRETCIGENSFLGIGSCILAGSTLGKQNIVGAGAIVKGDFPDYCVIAGNPARIIKIYNPTESKWMNFNDVK
jgi:acetyltransferase-like isoleucine patch superfamily enzyme